jgi:undecaprenyl-diphosphatase
MTILQAIILGIIEGVTEFLPISSTGHLILSSEVLKLTQTEFLKSFEIIIQLGAILAVVFLYWKSFFDPETIKKLIVAFIPTGVIGLALYKIVKTHLLGNNQVVLWSLVIGGVLIIVFEMLHKEKLDAANLVSDMTYKQAFGIGLFQAVAIIPGVSRSAATILGGLLMNINRRTIVEFSFLLAVPTMLAASSLDFVKSYEEIFSGPIIILAVGFIVAFIVAAIAIKYFLEYIRKHNFVPFGIYRIVVALLFWYFVL